MENVVRVEWDDIASCDEDESWEDALKARPIRCATFGLLLVEDSERVVVAGTIMGLESEKQRVNDTIAIPRGAVVKITRIGKA